MTRAEPIVHRPDSTRPDWTACGLTMPRKAGEPVTCRSCNPYLCAGCRKRPCECPASTHQ